MSYRNETPTAGRWCLGMLMVAVFAIGCADTPQSEEAISSGDAESSVVNTELFAQGEQVFNTTCSECHTQSPPPKLAPPIIMVAGHYMEEYENRDEAEQAVESWVTGPDAEHSAMPDHAIERFGLMPAQALPAEDAAAVAYYVFQLYEDEGGMEGMGDHEMGDMEGVGRGGMGEGHRMEGMGRGMGEDHEMEGMGRGGMGRGGEGAGMGDTTRMRRREGRGR